MELSNKINFLDMNCGNEGHESLKLVALCIDKSCSFPNKFVCLDCIFNFHEQHKLLKLKLIQDKINLQFESEANAIKDEQMVMMRLKDTEETVKMEVEKIKTNILEIFNNKVNNFLTEVNDRIMDFNKMSKIDSFDMSILMHKEIRHLTKEELDNLINYLNQNYVKGLSDSQILNTSSNDQSPNSKKKSPIVELQKFDDNFKKYIQDVNKTLCDFLNTKFLVTSSNILFSENLYFEWSEKTFGNYGLLYSFSNNKFTATKVQNDGTITILRAKDKLNFNENYYIEFYVDCKKFGDCEVGFGKESVGPSCWLRSQGAYGITNVGIYENGKAIKKEIRLEDGDVIGFEIYLKNVRTCKLLKNSKLVHEFKIDIDEIYPLAAIRKVGNSITVKDFKTLN